MNASIPPAGWQGSNRGKVYHGGRHGWSLQPAIDRHRQVKPQHASSKKISTSASPSTCPARCATKEANSAVVPCAIPPNATRVDSTETPAAPISMMPFSFPRRSSPPLTTCRRDKSLRWFNLPTRQRRCRNLAPRTKCSCSWTTWYIPGDGRISWMPLINAKRLLGETRKSLWS